MFFNNQYKFKNIYNVEAYGTTHDGWFLYNNPNTVTYYLRPVPASEYAKELTEQIECLKKLLRMTDCPEILIENPTSIFGEPSPECREWARGVIKKDQESRNLPK